MKKIISVRGIGGRRMTADMFNDGELVSEESPRRNKSIEFT
jgi:hypothetical protein